MLKFFVALLLIAEGMTESDICEYPPQCEPDDIPDKFPETEEELQKFCKTGIAYVKCIIHYEEACWEPEPEEREMGYRIIATIEEICSEETLLHAAVVESLKCFSELINDEMKFCPIDGHSPDRIRQFTEALSEEGLVSLTDDENDTYTLHECIGLMNFFACHSVTMQRECGDVAMDAYIDIVQKIGPGVVAGCENSYDLLPAVIRLYKLEEDKELSIAEVFKNRK